MNSLISSNISVYRAISEEAYLKMRKLIDAGRTPKANGGERWIIKYDPEQKSFKQAMISIVFTGMWLEALMHQKIVSEFDEQTFRDYDFKQYKEKLRLLGCHNRNILERAEKFRKCRKELVHEKAHFDTGEIKKAQDEAENARQLLLDLSEHFSN